MIDYYNISILTSESWKSLNLANLFIPLLKALQFEKKYKKGRFLKLLYATAHTRNRMCLTTNRRYRKTFYFFMVQTGLA